MFNYVVIDLGSNSVRLRITNVDANHNLNCTHQVKEYVRLSENMGVEKTLKEEPMKRTIAALKKFKEIYTALPNTKINALATAAVRQATNQKEFLKRVKKETGLNFEVISGEREAYLDFLGVTNTLQISDCLIMDTGGASTELILVQNNQVQNLISLPFGSVTLSSQFHLHDKITASSLFLAMSFAEQEITNIDWLTMAHKIPLIGLGGSNRTLAKITRRAENQSQTDLPNLHGYRLNHEDAFNIMSKLVALSRTEREKVPGLAKSRSDVVVGGLIPIMLILRSLHIDEIVFSNHGLREGSLYEYLQKQNDKSL